MGRKDNPFAALDALYTGILATSPNPRLAARWVYALNDNLSGTAGVVHMLNLLESFEGETGFLLGGLSSLLSITLEPGLSRFNLYHKSLLDFLQNPNRSGELHVGKADYEQFIADRCYHLMKNRGPQGLWIRKRDDTFIREFCQELHNYIDPLRSYEMSDITWWLDNYKNDSKPGYRDTVPIPAMFASIDKECPWSHCSQLANSGGIGYCVTAKNDRGGACLQLRNYGTVVCRNSVAELRLAAPVRNSSTS
ncbi:hypothetical protein NMY22_g19262 [Coprinellus aureogranulatus]|nr:hypothetical protein NMY22_g19262 [Coprinellus aureogranulatus]